MLKTSKTYGVDKNGFILTKASLPRIKKPFSKIISEVKNQLLDELEDQIHSIYVYGSVATGEAKPKKSDLDVLVVFKKKPRSKLKNQIENLSDKLSKKYKPIVREVGIALSDVKEVRADTYGWGCFIKHLCVDIYGENLSKHLPKFKPTKKVAEAFNGDCRKVVEATLKKLSGSPNKQEVLKTCSSTMRKIVRTGFSLVMEQEKTWTTDLKKSYLAFAKYHPEQKSQMKIALEMALTPTSSKPKLIQLLQELKPLLSTLDFKRENISSKVVLREAKPKDAEGIATIHVKTWQHAYKGQIPNQILDKLSIKERTQKWQEKLKKPDKNAKTFVAIVNGKIHGFSSSGPSRDKDSDKTTGELYAVYIAAERFGKGLGSSLVKKALAYLNKLGFKKATLWVLDTNKNAIKFYEKEGWIFDDKTKVENEKGFKLKEVRYRINLNEIEHKGKIEKYLGEKINLLELKASGACNDAYYVETESAKKFIVKKGKTKKDFIPQNSLSVEAALIKRLSKLNLSISIPKIGFVSKKPEMFGYEYIEGEPLIQVWKNLSKKERIKMCKKLGEFHSEIGKKVTKQMAKKCGIKVNDSTKLHPEVEKEYKKILKFKDIPVEFIELAQKAKIIFDQTLDLGVFQFIHNDAHHENIIIKNKKIAGIIDFGESEFGEIAKEFSRYIRDFHEDAEYIINAYEKDSGNKLPRKRLITNSFLSGLMENVEDYRKGGENRQEAIKSVQFYKKMIYKFKI